MHQSLLTRLFKSLLGNEEAPLMRIAYSIIEDERIKGHTILANKLNSILQEKISRSNDFSPTLKVAREQD